MKSHPEEDMNVNYELNITKHIYLGDHQSQIYSQIFYNQQPVLLTNCLLSKGTDHITVSPDVFKGQLNLMQNQIYQNYFLDFHYFQIFLFFKWEEMYFVWSLLEFYHWKCPNRCFSTDSTGIDGENNVELFLN